jgi:putative transposase
MMTAYKFRIYPSTQQEQILNETLETCRLLYNRLLDDRIKNHTGFFAQKRATTANRKNDKFLKRVYSQVVQDVVARLDKAYGAYFIGIARFPKFKRKGRYNSFTYPQFGFDFKGSRIRLSRIGNLRVRIHRPIIGHIRTCTIKKGVDRWFSIVVADSNVVPRPHESRPAVGVDLGVTHLVALSDGTRIESPRFLTKSVRKIKLLQRSLSRKRKSSANRTRVKSLLAKEWMRLRNSRDDFAHKVSRMLADEFSTIIFENLQIKAMTKNHTLASAIMDASWGKLRLLTAYKAERRGGQEVLVEPKGTSQECSGCGVLVPKSLSERTHLCPHCGLIVDRDVNAARNILKRGLERAHAEADPIPINRIGKIGPGSKKPAMAMVGGSLRKLS